MNKNRSFRWLCGATSVALGIATLAGCATGESGGEGGAGGSWDPGTTSGSGWGTTSGPGSTGTYNPVTTSTSAGGSTTTSTSTGEPPVTTSTSTSTTSASTGMGGAGTTTSTTTTSGTGEGGASTTTSTSSGTVDPEPHHKFVGNITTNGRVRDGFVDYWDQITPENEGKWGSVESSRGQRNWGPLDAIYKYAQDNNILFKHHVFVWGAQQPTWVRGLPGDQQRQAVRDWMQAFCQRYPETKIIDVVNEPPPHTTPDYKNGIGGDGASGWDWIVNSFKWAREFCPDAILVLNDYNNIEYPNDHNNFMNIARKVIEAGAPVDALGAQAHDAYKIDTNTVKGYIDKLASLGKPVYITEYDIGEGNDNRQKQIMEQQITMFYNHPNIPGITLWGYIVGATWRENTGLQQSNGTMRPAMQWLMDFLDRN